MAKQRNDAQLWLWQAVDDYRFGRLALRNQFHAQACFISQQAAEKAVKAGAYHLSMRPVLGHFRAPTGIDLLIYTPEEFARERRCNRFVRQALREGRRLL